MKYVKGDLIELADSGQWDVIVHGCNCFNTMGSGVAKAIRSRWPEAYEVDCQTTKGNIMKLGKVTKAFVETKAGTPLTIINAYTQYAYLPRTERHLDYCAVRHAFYFVMLQAAEQGADNNYECRILIPRLGAGLAGGDWTLICKIIDSYGLDVTCCALD